MKQINILVLLLFLSFFSVGQDIKIKNKVFEVLYSQDLEQPLWLKYRSTNRPINVSKEHINFYKENNIITSDDKDYRINAWDKGQGAPPATFSDSIDNLKQTFSYLNVIMQNHRLKKSGWAQLEEQERKWDDIENLTIIVKTFFDKPAKRVRGGGAIPYLLEKHIYFETQKEWRCYVFLNEKPKFAWEYLTKFCNDSEHNQ